MSLAEFQRELAQLVTTPEVGEARRRAWRASPGLTDRERRRLEAIADHRGLETARVIHRLFRASALVDGLPLPPGPRPGASSSTPAAASSSAGATPAAPATSRLEF